MAQMLQATRPQLSVGERDRRYAAIRQRLQERGVSCALVSGTNLFYLSNGISGEKYGLLPAEAGLPATVVINGRHLADIPAEVIIDSQDWISDVRPGNDAKQLIERVKELRLDSTSIGVVASDFNQTLYAQLQSALPNAKLVDVGSMFADVRTTKSEEEVTLLDQANHVFDTAVAAVARNARPGMLGAEVVQEGIKAMWAVGGDLDSVVNFGAEPRQNPVLAELCLTRRIQPGDIGTLTAHAEYGHYAGHSDQEISFGEPKPMHREMFDAVCQVRDTVLKAVKPGATQRDLIDTYEKACRETGFRSSLHSQIHQYGIDVPEFPGPAFTVQDGGNGAPAGRFGRAGNFVLAPGMIYSISPTLVAPHSEDLLLGGTSLVVTDGGYRELGNRKVEMLIAGA